MSRETVQFTEMVREAYAGERRPAGASLQGGEGEKLHYCWNCGMETWHTVEDRGPLDEIFTCTICGVGKPYRVR